MNSDDAIRPTKDSIKGSVLARLREKDVVEFIEERVSTGRYSEPGFFHDLFLVLADVEYEKLARDRKALQAEVKELRAAIERDELREKARDEQLFEANRRLMKQNSHVSFAVFVNDVFSTLNIFICSVR